MEKSEGQVARADAEEIKFFGPPASYDPSKWDLRQWLGLDRTEQPNRLDLAYKRNWSHLAAYGHLDHQDPRTLD